MDIREALPRLSAVSPQALSAAPFCISAAWRARLRRDTEGVVCEVWIEDDPHVAIDPEGRKMLERSSGASWKKEQLARFFGEGATEVVIASPDCPLAMSAGGALPLLRLCNGQEFFVLVQRDISPYGWNTASGLSSSLEEICTPLSIVFREMFEELLISVDDHAIVWRAPQFDSANLTKQNLAMWALDLQTIALPFALRENASKYKLIVHYKNATTVLNENIIVAISPTGIDALVIPIFEVPAQKISQLKIYGCEEHPSRCGTPLNPKVGLISTEEARKIVRNQTSGIVTIAAIFQDGHNEGPLTITLEQTLAKEKEIEESGRSIDELFGALTSTEKEGFLASRYCPTVYQAMQVFFA